MFRFLALPAFVLATMLLASSPVMADDAEKVSINSATAEQLASIPGVSEDVANAIIGYRDEMGDIQSLDELLDVEGMNRDLLEKIKEKVGVDAIAGSECNC